MCQSYLVGGTPLLFKKLINKNGKEFRLYFSYNYAFTFTIKRNSNAVNIILGNVIAAPLL